MARNKDFDKDEVLKKAICLFSYKGYAATSMQDIVDTLGVCRASIYDTFGNKHELYIKALKTYANQNVEQLKYLIDSNESMKEAISILLESLVNEWLNDELRKGCFMTNAGMELAAHDREVNELVCAGEQQIEDVLLQAVIVGQNAGDISSKQPPRTLTHFLINTIKGLQTAVKSNKDRAFFSDVIQASLSILD